MSEHARETVLEVSPHRYRPDKANTFADRARLSVRGGSLVVTDVRHREFVYPLATGSRQPDAVAALVVTRAGDADKASDGIEERLERVTADHRSLCVLPFAQWDTAELQEFCRASGLRWEVTPVLKNYSARSKAYPPVAGAPVLSAYTSRVTALLVAIVAVAIIVAVGLALLV